MLRNYFIFITLIMYTISDLHCTKRHITLFLYTLAFGIVYFLLNNWSWDQITQALLTVDDDNTTPVSTQLHRTYLKPSSARPFTPTLAPSLPLNSNTRFKDEPDDWLKVTLSEVVSTFSIRTMTSCNNTCVYASNCYNLTLEGWYSVLDAGSFTLNPLLSKGQYIYEFERDYLSYPPLEDMKQLPDVKLSKVTMFGVDNDTVRCLVGDTVTGRVDLVDGYGQPRTIGGDEVRVWLVESGTKQYRSSGHVTDFNNGSYLITAWCLWPGMTQVNVAVAYPREYLRSVIDQTHLSVSRFVFGKFSYNSIEEETVCWSTPNIVGRSCICNFTEFVGQSFYCGRPLNIKLNCYHWVATSAGPMIQPAYVTPSERALILNISTHEIMDYSIPNSILLVSYDKGASRDLKPCSQTSLNVTWDLTSTPDGFWGPNVTWASLKCHRPKSSPQWAQKCLKDSQIWVIGDSNSVRMFNYLTVITNCTDLSGEIWPMAGICTNIRGNISVTYMPHELPFYQDTRWAPRRIKTSIPEYIASTPSVGKYIFIVHYYLHLMPSHLSVAHSRLLSLSKAIRELVYRNPDVLVAFRGPHVASFDWAANHAIGGDSLGEFYAGIIQETFHDLKDKVLYLDGWGMTVALENSEFHPTNRVPEEMIRTLLAFRCDETGYVPRD